jgi:uncharacterized protein YjbJ (UPF0337 family)
MKPKTLTQKGIAHSASGKRNFKKGQVEDALGAVTGDAGLQLRGKIKQAKGKLQDGVGKIERKIERMVDRNS